MDPDQLKPAAEALRILQGTPQYSVFFKSGKTPIKAGELREGFIGQWMYTTAYFIRQ